MSVPLVRTLVLYFAVICAVRLMGKRQLGSRYQYLHSGGFR